MPLKNVNSLTILHNIYFHGISDIVETLWQKSISNISLTYHQCGCSQQSPSEELQKYDDDSMINTGGPETLRLSGDTYTTVQYLIVRKKTFWGVMEENNQQLGYHNKFASFQITAGEVKCFIPRIWQLFVNDYIFYWLEKVIIFIYF